jgi:hypothetical protein
MSRWRARFTGVLLTAAIVVLADPALATDDYVRKICDQRPDDPACVAGRPRTAAPEGQGRGGAGRDGGVVIDQAFRDKVMLHTGLTHEFHDDSFAKRIEEFEALLGYPMKGTQLNGPPVNAGLERLLKRDPNFMLVQMMPVIGFAKEGRYKSSHEAQLAVAWGDWDYRYREELEYYKNDLKIKNAVFFLGIEVELDRGGWCGGPDHPEAAYSYMAAAKRVADMVHAYGYKTMMNINYGAHAQWCMENAFPGRQYIDILSRNIYDSSHDWPTKLAMLEHLRGLGRKYGVQIGMLEWGLAVGDCGTYHGDNPRYIENMLKWWAALPPEEMWGIVYFNVPWCASYLDKNPKSRQKYIEMLKAR